MTNLFVDIHLLQDVPPANLNRDESGSPKTARYGGVDRLRVSSQAWKRATRKEFLNHLDPSTLGMRTRRVQEAVVNALVAAGVPAEKASPIMRELLAPLKITAGKKDAEAAYLLFFSRPQLARLAENVAALRDHWDAPAEIGKQIDVKQILGKAHSLDVALFGRMVADVADINVDAAAQVAHALATHSCPTQFDYFTAVDDAQEDAETGAGMIGTIEFNSAVLYRYATVNFPALVDNMGDPEQAVQGVAQFLRGFALSMPTGKQNTFAAHTRPALVWVQLRHDQPVNYMSAFEKPVHAGSKGYLGSSLERLGTFVAAETQTWGDAPLLSITAGSGVETFAAAHGPGSVTVAGSFDELVRAVTDRIVQEPVHA